MAYVRTRAWLVLVGLALGVSACGDDGADQAGQYGESCSSDDDCAAPFRCATGGQLNGACELSCMTDADCLSQLSTGYQCDSLSDTCVARCPAANACSGEAMVASCPGDTSCRTAATVGDCTIDFCRP
jgi:hypothetical protein